MRGGGSVDESVDLQDEEEEEFFDCIMEVKERPGSRKAKRPGKTHPTITAKQNQMYLITTVNPGPNDALINRTLPKELILDVFSHLDVVSLCRCAQVCRLWNMLALDGSNWMEVDLFTFQKEVKAPVIENLARRCGGFLKKLSLKGCENIQDQALRSFTSKCSNIEHLSLYKCKRVTDATCENLGRYCHKLRHLNLENCTAITDRAMKYISEGCKRLEYLNISWCDNVHDKGIQLVLSNCPQLNTLVLRGCDALTENVFEGVEGPLPAMQRLNLLSCFIVDESVASVSSLFPYLQCLCLSMCTHITDRALHSLAAGCKNLVELELAGCTLLSDGGFLQLSRNCRQLERMDLEDCSLITDSSIHSITNNCSNLTELVSLYILTFRYLTFYLHFQSLSHCELITDESIHFICSNNRDKIQVLELDNCPLITDSALSAMRHARSLSRIDLYDCQGVSKEAIQRFKTHRPGVSVHAYFAPSTPPTAAVPARARVCRCCSIL